ncbi:MAG: lipocalin family protein [Gammaproteobacteria bacterium]|jgi:apolipoprotein D and lipocalin family protein
MKRSLALILCTAAFLGAGCAGPRTPLPTVETVDLDRYAGRWYEIAHLPNRFQAKCLSDTRATYTREGERITVLNECRTKDGSLDSARGIARVVEGSGNGKLRVSFFRPFYGNYWILARDPDYRWVLVGEPTRRYAWILARTSRLDPDIRETLFARAAALGFDRSAFRATPHTQQ